MSAHGGISGGSTLDKLVYMVNQISREFSSQRPHDAVDATWDHIWHFWDPRMREMIIAHLDAGAAGLSEIARAAIEKLRDDGVPPSQTKATEFNSAGGDPDLMSDAG